MKLLVILLVLALLVWLVVGSSRRRNEQARRHRPGTPAADRAEQVEGMVACANCGVHLPSSLALAAHGQTYCSAGHRDAGPAKP